MAMATSSAFSDQVAHWVALRTSAHWEKILADSLARCAVPVYLPLMTRISVYRSKRHEAEVPLFPGYVFCSEHDFRGNAAVPPPVRRRIAQVLRPPDYGKLREELTRVANFLADRQLVQERVYGRPGETVRVVGGLFAGQCGVIRKLKPSEGKIVLEITFLSAKVEVAVVEQLLERV